MILGWEDPLEKEMATHSISCLENLMDRGAWRATVQCCTEVDITEATWHARMSLFRNDVNSENNYEGIHFLL